MRIVHLVDTSSRLAGGMFESVKGLAHGQQQLGLQVSVVAGTDEFTDTDRPSWGNIDLFNVPSSGFTDGILGREIIAKIDQIAPDLIHLHGIWGVAGRALSQRSRRNTTPYVVSPRGMVDDWALKRSARKKKFSAMFWENRLLRNATHLHALTSSEANSLRALGLDSNLAIIPNGVTLPPSEDRESNARLEPPRNLLFLGRLHPKKNISSLLSAWASLPSPLLMEWRLIVAGWDDADTLNGLLRQARELNLADSVSFPGGVYGDEKDALLANASAFILPSFSEGLPMAILEAWSHSLPVFKTLECNIPEGFEVGAAIQIRTDPESMAEVLAESLTDPFMLNRVGQAGRKLVSQRFGWDVIATEMSRLYSME